MADARTAAQNDYAARGVGNSSIHVYGIRDIDFAEAQARIDELATAARDVARLRQIEPDIDSELAAFARHAREATSELAESWVRIRAQRGMQEDLSDGQAVKRQHQLLAEYIDRSAAGVRAAIEEGLPMTPRRAGWTPGHSAKDGGKLLLGLVSKGRAVFHPDGESDDERLRFDRLVGELQELADAGLIEGLKAQPNHRSAIGAYDQAWAQSLTAKGWRVVEGSGASSWRWIDGLNISVLTIVAVWLFTGNSRLEPLAQMLSLVPNVLLLIAAQFRR